MNEPVEKKTSLDDYLDNVDYVKINNYVPSEFALNFMNFIKLVNGSEGESNKTPPIHLMMLDKLTEKNKFVANLCFRGSGKTSVFAEYLFLYLGCFRKLPNLGTIEGAIYVSDSMENGVKSLRNNMEHRYNNSEFLQKYLPYGQQKFTDSAITFTNADGKTFGLKMFGATTGIRGTKINGKRPMLAILDDLMSDEAARSPTILKSIKDTIYKGIMPALDPTNGRVIFNGTPFNSQDVMIEAVESGAWNVNVYPVCEKFPCDPKEFHGAWEDRFPYEVVKEKYDLAIGTGHPDAFYQQPFHALPGIVPVVEAHVFALHPQFPDLLVIPDLHFPDRNAHAFNPLRRAADRFPGPAPASFPPAPLPRGGLRHRTFSPWDTTTPGPCRGSHTFRYLPPPGGTDASADGCPPCPAIHNSFFLFRGETAPSYRRAPCTKTACSRENAGGRRSPRNPFPFPGRTRGFPRAGSSRCGHRSGTQAISPFSMASRISSSVWYSL